MGVYARMLQAGQATGANSTPVALASDLTVATTKKVALSTLASGIHTVSTTGSPLAGFAGASALIIQLAVTAVSGTLPNMITVIEDSIDSLNWNILATFTAVTGITNQTMRVSGPFCNSVRTRCTITGTTPSITLSVLVQSEGGV